ncbi:HNH endonuclease [Salinisphaera sp. USBA-960]|nr:HNH endonuclease [Salifodinibacter halophilus]NNC26830.1 HNH endonuclease [Salifodinibacter halophilus]
MNQGAIPRILKLDVGGLPVAWIDWREAVGLHFTDKVAWGAGSAKIRLRGGRSRETGRRSSIDIDSIIAVEDRSHRYSQNLVPTLTRRELYHRDGGLCLYCGDHLTYARMQIEHVVPKSCNGAHEWTNVVSACGPCNRRKDNRTPEQAGMKLMALPYEPNLAEWLILSNRRILADQQAFLERLAPRRGRGLS